MATFRFSPRFALLDLELRRLLREPWVPAAAVALAPLALVLALRGTAQVWAPGLLVFGQIAQGGLVVFLVALVPLLGLAFRGEHQADHLELLQVAGFSPFALLAGIAGSRMVVAMMILILPVPPILLSHALGGMSGSGMLSALALLFAASLLCASLALLASLLFPSGVLAWVVGLGGGAWLLFSRSGALARILRLVALPEGVADFAPAGRTLALAAALAGVSWLRLRWLLRHRNLGRAGERPPAGDRHPRSRPLAPAEILWLLREFFPTGPVARCLPWCWHPLVLLPLLGWLASSGRAIDAASLAGVQALALGIGLFVAGYRVILLAEEAISGPFRNGSFDLLVLARPDLVGLVGDQLRAVDRCLFAHGVSALVTSCVFWLLLPLDEGGWVLPLLAAATGVLVGPLLRTLALNLVISLAWGGASTGYVVVKRVAAVLVQAVVTLMLAFNLLHVAWFNPMLALGAALPAAMWLWWSAWQVQIARRSRVIAELACLSVEETPPAAVIRHRFPLLPFAHHPPVRPSEY